jgi:hypothetical protein
MGLKNTSRASTAVMLLCAINARVLADPAATERKPAEAVRRENVQRCFGTYNAAPRGEDGHVDVRRMLADLVELRANTYNWLIWHADTDWEDLQRFLPLARERRIKIWVTLVPPSESPPKTKRYSEPYRLDYERWAVEIARLSVRETNLVAWSIDDFIHNLKEYTPERTRRMVAAAREINPALAFVPCCYYRQITPAFAEQYRELMDGILFPYRDESGGANLTNAGAVEAEVRTLRQRLGPGLPIIVDVYATKHSRLGDSTPEYVRQVMETGRKCADGVLIYCHQDKVTNAAKYEVLKSTFHSWATASRPTR